MLRLGERLLLLLLMLQLLLLWIGGGRNNLVHFRKTREIVLGVCVLWWLVVACLLI